MGALSGMASLFARTPGMGLPPLPGNLGLPPLPAKVGQGFNQGKNPREIYDKGSKEILDKQMTDANTYNKAFADLLNQQPQLNGSERSQLYSAYSVGVMDSYKGAKPTDFSGTLSQAAAGAQQPQAPAPAPAPAPQAAPAPAPAPVPVAPVPAPPRAEAPQTVGPVAKPVEPQPAPTPVVATEGGNIAGKTTSTVSASGNPEAPNGGRGRRGRFATLLTGLGGAVEGLGS